MVITNRPKVAYGQSYSSYSSRISSPSSSPPKKNPTYGSYNPPVGGSNRPDLQSPASSSSSSRSRSSSSRSSQTTPSTQTTQSQVSQPVTPQISLAQESFTNLNKPTSKVEPGTTTAQRIVQQEQTQRFTPSTQATPYESFLSIKPTSSPSVTKIKSGNMATNFIKSSVNNLQDSYTSLQNNPSVNVISNVGGNIGDTILKPLLQDTFNTDTTTTATLNWNNIFKENAVTYETKPKLKPGDPGYIYGGAPEGFKWIAPTSIITWPSKIQSFSNLIAKEKAFTQSITSSKYVKPVVDVSSKLWNKLPIIGKDATRLVGAGGVAYTEAVTIAPAVTETRFKIVANKQEEELYSRPGVKEAFAKARSEAKSIDKTGSYVQSFGQEALPYLELTKQKKNVPIDFTNLLSQQGLITKSEKDVALSLGSKRLSSEISGEATILPLLERRTEILGRSSDWLKKVSESGASKTKQFFQSVPFFAGASAIEGASQSIGIQKVRTGEINWEEVGKDTLFGVGTGTVLSTNIFVEPKDISKTNLNNIFSTNEAVLARDKTFSLNNNKINNVELINRPIDTPTTKALETAGTIGSPFEGMGDTLADLGDTINIRSGGRTRSRGGSVRSSTFPNILQPPASTTLPSTQTDTQIKNNPFIQEQTQIPVQIPSQTPSQTNIFTQFTSNTQTPSQTNIFTQFTSQTNTQARTQPNIFTGNFPSPFFPSQGSGDSVKNIKLFKASRPSKYVSDVASSILNLRGTAKQGSVFTGLGLRPLMASGQGNGRRTRRYK